MKYEVKISEDETFVWQLPRENMKMKLAYEMSLEAIKLARTKGIKKYLSDVRGIRNIDSVSENFEFAYTKVPAIGYGRSDKIAVVHDPDDKSHAFIETVSQNAGYHVKLFTDIQEAIDWLGVEDSPIKIQFDHLTNHAV